jgi:hypothetical protein
MSICLFLRGSLREANRRNLESSLSGLASFYLQGKVVFLENMLLASKDLVFAS